MGTYFTDGTRLLCTVPVPEERDRQVALEDCASLAIEYYTRAQFRRLDLTAVTQRDIEGDMTRPDEDRPYVEPPTIPAGMTATQYTRARRYRRKRLFRR